MNACTRSVGSPRASAQVSLFGEAGDDLPEPRLANCDDWMPADRLAQEHQAIGFYLSGHPLDDYAPALKRKGLMTLADLQQKAERDGAAVARVGVLVSGLQERKSARGTRFFRMNISDPSGQVAGIVLFPEDFDACRRVFDQTPQVVMSLEARFNEGQFDPVARSAAPMEGVVADAGGAGLRIHIDSDQAVASVAALLNRIREEAKIRTRGPILFCIANRETGEEVEIATGADFPVNPQIKGAIKAMAGVLLVEEI